MNRRYFSRSSSIITTLSRNPLAAGIYSKLSDSINSYPGLLLDKAKASWFGPTAYEICKDIDLTGKTCVITGGTTGIGKEVVKCLLGLNCDVVMACRNPYVAATDFKSITNSEKLRIFEVNLSSLSSTKKFTEKMIKDGRNIDILLLNAGVFGLPWSLTADKLETIFQVNYLSQYYLLSNVEKILAENARVVFISAESHRNVKLELNPTRPLFEETFSLPQHEYTSIKAYNLSKLCGIFAMHVYGYKWMGNSKSVFAAHPGSFVKTSLCRNWWLWETLYSLMVPFSKDSQRAAATPVYCCTSPELDGISDVYVKDCQVAQESDLAKDLHLAFKVDSLTRAIINDRLEMMEEDKEVDYDKPLIVFEQKPADENMLIS